MNQIIEHPGVVSAGALVEEGANQISVSQSLAVSLARAEVDQQIATARAMPRSIKRAVANITTLATLDDVSAEECVYALPRGGKPIKGPSVRLAEIIASQWGNCRVGARVVHVDRFEKFVEAEGVFHDLEFNTATTARVRRRISDRQGRLLTDDMIVVTGNAACAIAKRNAILGAVPKAVWRKAYEAVEGVIAGDIKTLAERREKMLKAFAAFGVKPEQIFEALEIEGLDDINLDRIGVLTGMHAALKNGEADAEEMFPAKKVASIAPKGAAAKLDAIEARAAQAPHDPETGEIIQSQNPSGAASAPTSAAGEPPQASQPAAGTQETGLPPGPSPASENPIVATARDKAKQGLARLNMWMKALSEADEAALSEHRAELFEAAKAADAAKKGG